MKGITFIPGLISFLLSSGIITPAFSQVTPDNTTNTTVNTNNNNFNILNGIQKGNNLFHSFKEFSIPTGGKAVFQNSSAIVNIINRVTGGNISNIDGLIKANGSASVFLINPAGIVFGKNASLDIGGSFLGSTAESLVFEDGFNYSAIDSQETPLLTVSVPLGLQMGANPGDITVRGKGHQISPVSTTGALQFNNTPVGLEVSSGNSLVLLGGNINLESGILTAAGGNIELGSVQPENNSAFIALLNENGLLTLDYESSQKLGNIQLQQEALLNISGIGTGGIQVKAQNLFLQNGSALVWENRGNQAGTGINIQTSDTVQLLEQSSRGFRSGIYSDAQNSGSTGNITISTGKFLMSEGANITNRTFTTAPGNDITLSTNEIQLRSPNSVANSISTRTLGTGAAGNLTVDTQRLIVQGRGGFSSNTNNASGKGGDLIINASESIDLVSGPDGIPGIAVITASTLGGTGDAGSVIINTSILRLEKGSSIGSSTFGPGNGGSITVNASESIDIVGTRTEPITGLTGSSITAEGFLVPPTTRRLFGLPDNVTGDGGDIIINTPKLQLRDGGDISVRHDDLGQAGSIVIKAEELRLKDNGLINASTTSGEGGSIDLILQDSLLLRSGSLISTEAKGAGNGGNITINSPIIAGFENSDVIANAVEGNGGNINITTQGLFGLKFADQLTSESDITASSEFGINGTVEINNIAIDPNSGLLELPAELTDSSQKIGSGCSSNTDSSFVATGRGGIPQNPNERVDTNHPWLDIRDLSTFRQRNTHVSKVTTISNKPAIIEATGFIRNEDGEIEFVAVENTPLRTKQVAECSGTDT